jgi:ketol-acid reductoisomerase
VTQPLRLRPEQPPDDITVVLCAGVMSSDNVRRAAERTFAVYAVYGISVEGVIGMTVQEACRGERIASYRRVRGCPVRC